MYRIEMTEEQKNKAKKLLIALFEDQYHVIATEIKKEQPDRDSPA